MGVSVATLVYTTKQTENGGRKTGPGRGRTASKNLESEGHPKRQWEDHRKSRTTVTDEVSQCSYNITG